MVEPIYKPGQLECVAGKLTFTPKWLLICGVGTGNESEDAHKLWPRCEIIGLEPATAAFDAVKDRFVGRLLNKAAWLRKTTLRLYASDTCLYGNLFNLEEDKGDYTNVWPGKVVVGVQTTTLDALSEELGPFRSDVFLWMDVEYAELPVLMGARKLLESGAVRAVNFENHPSSVCPGKSLAVQDVLTMHGLEKVCEYMHEGGHHWDELWEVRT